MNQNEIIEEYKELHKGSRFSRGTALLKHVPELTRLAQLLNVSSVLDYGCGKAVFWKTPNWRGIFNNVIGDLTLYDPAVPEFSTPPPDTRFDMVICTDVLEHVHPDHTVEFLDRLLLYTRRVLFLNVSTTLAKKTFKDGTNLHINVRTRNEWEKLIRERQSELGVKKATFPAVVVRYDEEVNF